MAEDLFGEPAEFETLTPSTPRRVSNDMDKVMRVISFAVADCGYVLSGPSERVFRKVDKEYIKKTVWWEADVVKQLIGAGWLRVGGSRFYSHQGKTRPCRSVLVPKSTRARWNMWKS